VPT
jgi:hypothetical protein